MFKDEKDYFMRQVQMAARMLALTLFQKEQTEYRLPEGQPQSEADRLYLQMRERVDRGEVNEAENLLFEKTDWRDLRFLEVALDFYDRLNGWSEEELAACGYSHEEVEEGLREVAGRFGAPYDGI